MFCGKAGREGERGNPQKRITVVRRGVEIRIAIINISNIMLF
jgi:hypothetical protein